ncbi:2Fe-2S iron-sulfur cluster binding domain-containing protein [Cognatilysobacter terrigena]|uniref:2Fe-2S iron-sulfur cluster binding domain-containing protein n=1 Tax=Cognatilysobacter terrigena TaxID=2488749 RepID=UPI00105F0DB8|nr:2Fe-2S iron-sulfur cluster binding domain-containing protein [Lysobacter terrigena]
MKPWLARVHRWLGLVIGLQVVLWLASGLTMSLLDPAAVEGAATRAPAPATRTWPQGTRTPGEILAAHGRSAERIESAWLLDTPVWRVSHGETSVLRDAYTGATIEIDPATARTIASRDYSGAVGPGTPERLERAPLEARGHAGPLWRVPFADDAHTTLYVSAQDGRILERRTDAFRWFDIAWMLHIMDYTGRADFNHPLVVATAGGGVLLAISGLWLLGFSVAQGELRPRAWRRRGGLRVLHADDALGVTVPAREGETVLAALARAGLHLPSQCGGGQTCGQCAVKVDGRVPRPGAGDRARLPRERLIHGERLACALPVREGLSVHVPTRDAMALHVARIERITPISPTLREIVLRPASALPPLAAGQFIELDIPAFEVDAEAVSDPRAPLPASLLAHARPIAFARSLVRAYSPSLTPSLSDGALPLLVRLEHGLPDAGWIGRGSGYLFSRRVGDRMQFRGPFGAFRLKPGTREKIFIGGGAGVAPLRAMLWERLEAGGRERMHLWIGARTPDEVPYHEELLALDAAHPHVDVHVVYSEWGNATGGPRWIHEAVYDGLLHSHGALAECEFYLCGPPAMLDAARSLLADIGVEPARIAYDDFG